MEVNCLFIGERGMSNKLLVIGIIAVFTVLIPLSFESINDYANYTVPLKSAEFDDVNIGDFHYEGVDQSEKYYATISKITPIDKNTIRIDFNANQYRNLDQTPIPDFSHSTLIGIDQAFVVTCTTTSLKSNLYPAIGVLQYLGMDTKKGKQVYKFFHTAATLKKEMICNHPKVIDESLNLNYSINIPKGMKEKFDKMYGFSESAVSKESQSEKSGLGTINPEKDVPVFFEVMLMEQEIEWEMPQRDWNNPDFELESPARICSQIINSDGMVVYLSTVWLNPHELSDMTFHDLLPDDCMKVLPVTQYGRK